MRRGFGPKAPMCGLVARRARRRRRPGFGCQAGPRRGFGCNARPH